MELAAIPDASLFRRETLSLADMLHNRTVLHFFQKFLELEFSEENLLFYLEVERFKALTSQADLQLKALELYWQYVDPDSAPQLINLTQETVALIQLALEPLLEDSPKLGTASPGATGSQLSLCPPVTMTPGERRGSTRYDSLSVRLKRSVPLSVLEQTAVERDLFDQAAVGKAAYFDHKLYF